MVAVSQSNLGLAKTHMGQIIVKQSVNKSYGSESNTVNHYMKIRVLKAIAGVSVTFTLIPVCGMDIKYTVKTAG